MKEIVERGNNDEGDRIGGQEAFEQVKIGAEKMRETLNKMQIELLDMHRKVNKQANENIELRRLKVEEPMTDYS